MLRKNFVIKCKNCKWLEESTGLTSDLTHLKERNSCAKCNGRTFQCPNCGNVARMIRIRGNT